MFIEKDLVMLPTNEKATSSVLLGVMPNVATLTKDVLNDVDDWMKFGKPQHLCILSDEEIKEGDWYVNININKVLQCNSQNIGVVDLFKQCKKIIATTDKLNINLNIADSYRSANCLPQIPQSFIEHFIFEYNKGNIITKVMVEYEVKSKEWIINKYPEKQFNDKPLSEDCYDLKINSDNTINIKPIKDSWNRKEIINILIDLYDNQFDIDEERDVYIRWIEENL